MRPSGRMFCFTAPPRAPAGACSAPPPARPGAPGEQRSESFPPTQRPSGTLPARAKCGTLSSQRPRTPPAPGQILRKHHARVPLPSPARNATAPRPKSRRIPHLETLLRDPRASSRLPSFTMALLTRVQGRGALHLLSRLPCRHGALQTPHGPHRPRRSSPSLRNAACTPTSVHRSTARKSPVLPAGRTGREASEASTAARKRCGLAQAAQPLIFTSTRTLYVPSSFTAVAPVMRPTFEAKVSRASATFVAQSDEPQASSSQV